MYYKKEFNKSVGLPDETTIYTLLVDREGKIFEKIEGRFTAENLKALETKIIETALVELKKQ